MSPRKSHFLTAAAITLGFGLLAAPSHAAIVYLVSDISSPPSLGFSLSPNRSDYAQFTLTSPGITGTGVAAYLEDTGIGGVPASVSNLSASIVNDNAGVPGTTIFAASTGTSGTLTTTTYDAIAFTIPVTSLPAGTYWLEITHANVSEDALFWAAAASPNNTGNDGTVNKHFNTSTSNADAGLLNVTGNVAVPEPASIAVFGIPAAMALLRRRRRVI